MMGKGDRGTPAKDKISKLILPYSEVQEFPLETLVVNPFDPTIPKEQKCFVYQPYRWGSDLIEVIFVGAAQYLASHEKTAYQVVMSQRNPWREVQWMARFTTDTEYVNGNDIGLALDYCKEIISADGLPEGNLIDQGFEIVQNDMREYRIKRSLGQTVQSPFVTKPMMSIPALRQRGASIENDVMEGRALLGAPQTGKKKKPGK